MSITVHTTIAAARVACTAKVAHAVASSTCPGKVRIASHRNNPAVIASISG